MIIILTIAVILICVVIYAHKQSMDNMIDRIEELEEKLEKDSEGPRYKNMVEILDEVIKNK